jgi:beta-aspartyl-peptidase (threonine type)
MAALVVCVGAAVSCGARSTSAPAAWGIVIHTGSGNFTLENLGERGGPMRAAMIEALGAGHRVLAGGGNSLDAVQAAIVVLEDSPHFNAGKGAVFTHDGTNELDASLMDGATRRAGAVAGLKHVRNPIALARLVMEKSPHVMMAGAGAEAFAQSQGVELVPERYFFTQRQWDALQRTLAAEKAAETKGSSAAPAVDLAAPGAYFGTVGAVALDQHGNLAAGTSTGGMMNKRFGRIGDSPVIGAGTFASNRSCAISSTGHGEYFIRYSVAHDICARVEYGSVSAQAAADDVVQRVLKDAGGEGGVVGLDRRGRVVMSFNSTGMGRGYMGSDGTAVVMFTRDDAVAVGPR